MAASERQGLPASGPPNRVRSSPSWALPNSLTAGITVSGRSGYLICSSLWLISCAYQSISLVAAPPVELSLYCRSSRGIAICGSGMKPLSLSLKLSFLKATFLELWPYDCGQELPVNSWFPCSAQLVSWQFLSRILQAFVTSGWLHLLHETRYRTFRAANRPPPSTQSPCVEVLEQV